MIKFKKVSNDKRILYLFIFRFNQETKDYKNNILKFQWYLHMNQDSSDQFNETSGSRSGPITCSLVRHSRERLLHTSLILCVFHGERMFERYVWDSQEAIYRRKKKRKERDIPDSVKQLRRLWFFCFSLEGNRVGRSLLASVWNCCRALRLITRSWNKLIPSIDYIILCLGSKQISFYERISYQEDNWIFFF